MAKRIAQFHKVSFDKFQEGFIDCFGPVEEREIRDIYEAIKLPVRATRGSAGYDFFAPLSLSIAPGRTVKVPTGIRVEMQENWVLKCYPRSGLGFKYRLQLNNTVGIIDSDYFYSPMTPMKGRRWRLRRGPDSCRVSSWNTVSRWTTRYQQSETADWGVLQIDKAQRKAE